MLARRLLVVMAILMGITALTAGLAAPPPRQAAPTPTPESGAPAASPGTVVEETLEVGAPEARTVAVQEGDILRLSVAGDVLDVVEIEGLDRTAPISPELEARFDILADDPGAYPVVLVSDRERVGTVRITPRREE